MCDGAGPAEEWKDQKHPGLDQILPLRLFSDVHKINASDHVLKVFKVRWLFCLTYVMFDNDRAIRPVCHVLPLALVQIKFNFLCTF